MGRAGIRLVARLPLGVAWALQAIQGPDLHMPARIEDVAAHAGVSTKTVSRVLNGYASVRAKLRTRIEASIRALNYVPNASARSLAGNRSYLVALLYDNPMAGSSYTMEVIVGVLQACKGTPYNAVLHPFDAADDLAARIDGFVATHRPDALVLVPPHANNAELLQRLDELLTAAAVAHRCRLRRAQGGGRDRRAPGLARASADRPHRRAEGARCAHLAAQRLSRRVAQGRHRVRRVAGGGRGFRFRVGRGRRQGVARPAASPNGDLRRKRRHGLRRDARGLRTRAGDSRRPVGMRLRRHAGIAAGLARPDHGAPAVPRARLPGRP